MRPYLIVNPFDNTFAYNLFSAPKQKARAGVRLKVSKNAVRSYKAYSPNRRIEAWLSTDKQGRSEGRVCGSVTPPVFSKMVGNSYRSDSGRFLKRERSVNFKFYNMALNYSRKVKYVKAYVFNIISISMSSSHLSVTYSWKRIFQNLEENVLF